MKLIDKDKVVAEIERMLHETVNNTDGSPYYGGRAGAFTAILSFINTLEVKEEVLDEEGKAKLMKKCVHKAYKRGYDMGVLKTISEMNHKEVIAEQECTCNEPLNRIIGGSWNLLCPVNKLGLKTGDKVKVIIKAQKGE